MNPCYPPMALLRLLLLTAWVAGSSCTKNKSSGPIQPPDSEPIQSTDAEAAPPSDPGARDGQDLTGGSTSAGTVPPDPAAPPQAPTTAPEAPRVERLKGTLRLFLPFRGSRENLEFDKVVGYRIVVPVGFDEASHHDAVGIVTLNRGEGAASAFPSKRLKAIVKNDFPRGGVWLDINGVSREDKDLVVTGCAIPVQPATELSPTDHVFHLPLQVEAGGEFDVQVDIARNEVKKIPRAVPSPKTAPGKAADAPPGISVSRPRQLRSISPHTTGLNLVEVIQGYPLVTDMYAGQDYLFAATGTGQTLEIFDLWEPGRIRRLSSFTLHHHADPFKKAWGRNPRQWFSEYLKVAAQGCCAYVLNSGYGVKEDLMILNVQNPAAPSLLGIYDSHGEPQDLHLEDGKVYLLTNTEFQMVDVENPRAPRLAHSYRLFEGEGSDLFDMEVVGDHVYIGGYRRRTEVILLDISEPSSIKEVSSWGFAGLPWALRSFDRRLFISEAETRAKSLSSVRIYSIKSPAKPQGIASIPLEKNQAASGLLVSEDRLYVSIVSVPFDQQPTSPFDFLKVYDIRDVRAPRLVDAYGVQGGCPAQPIVKHGRHLFLGTLKCGIIMLDEGRR